MLESGPRDITIHPLILADLNILLKYSSNSELEEWEHMKKIQQKFGIRSDRLYILGSVEQMWSLIKAAPEVITDHYEPGVAAKILGVKLSLTKLANENHKLKGLDEMCKYSSSKIKKMNEDAFDKLQHVLVTNS